MTKIWKGERGYIQVPRGIKERIIAGEYSDEGKSGKSVEGRPQFQQMLQDIESCKDNIDSVLVIYKKLRNS